MNAKSNQLTTEHLPAGPLPDSTTPLARRWSPQLGQLIERILAPHRARAANQAAELARQRKLQQYD